MKKTQEKYTTSGTNYYEGAGKAISEAHNKDLRSTPYRVAYNRITNNIAAAILLERIRYEFQDFFKGDFYHYREPCDSAEEGATWTEILGFTPGQFDYALSKLGEKVTRGDDKGEIYNRCLVIWWTDSNRKTWYRLNEKHFHILVGVAYENPQLLAKKIDLTNLRIENGVPNYIISENSKLGKSENLGNSGKSENLGNSENPENLYKESVNESNNKSTPRPEKKSPPSEEILGDEITERSKKIQENASGERMTKEELELAAYGVGVDKPYIPDWLPADLQDGKSYQVWKEWCEIAMYPRPNKEFQKGDKRWINEIRDLIKKGYSTKHFQEVRKELIENLDDYAYVKSPRSIETRLQKHAVGGKKAPRAPRGSRIGT